MPEKVKKHKKAVVFCLEEGKNILGGDMRQTVDDTCTSFVKMPPVKDCCYVLYDATYQTKKGKKDHLMFTIRTP